MSITDFINGLVAGIPIGAVIMIHVTKKDVDRIKQDFDDLCQEIRDIYDPRPKKTTKGEKVINLKEWRDSK